MNLSDLPESVRARMGIAGKSKRKVRKVNPEKFIRSAEWVRKMLDDNPHFIPLRTYSEANRRDHWAVKAKRIGSQHYATTRMLTILRPVQLSTRDVKLKITLTRHAPGTLDSDNLASAFKAVRDAVAAYIGIDDGSPFYEWRYAQAKAPRGCYGVSIGFEVIP